MMENPSRNGLLLHRKLRDIISRDIYTGKYRDGSFLPPERVLAERYGVSRVTVRGTLARMEEDGLISRQQGNGTRVKLRTSGFRTAMDTIAVVAPGENPFFASFISNFDTAAEAKDAMVVFKSIGQSSMEDILFRFYQRDIRNAVVWPYDECLCDDALKRLRGIGMNIVLFDRVINTGFADCVSVDNVDAVTKLYEYLCVKSRGEVAYIGWDNNVITSNTERESAYRKLAGEDGVYRLPWRREREPEEDVAELMTRIPKGIKGVLCGNGMIGICVKKYCMKRRRNMDVACIDNLPGAEALSLTVYEQPMKKLACEVYARLLLQAGRGDDWRAETTYVKGRLRRR